jgi:hypothetical protein
MREIKKVAIWPAAKIFLILGVINGILLNIILLFTGDLQGVSLSALDMLLLIVLQAATWFIGAIVVAFLYNLLAKWVGGVKLEI